MAESIDEISYDYEEDGRLVRKELDRKVLSKGAWSTLMFLYQELDKKTEDWRPPKVAIVRYKKFNGMYRKQSGFNISSEKQARAIVEAIEGWFDGEAGQAGEAASDDAPSADE
jgi:hypothetical protein